MKVRNGIRHSCGVDREVIDVADIAVARLIIPEAENQLHRPVIASWYLREVRDCADTSGLWYACISIIDREDAEAAFKPGDVVEYLSTSTCAWASAKVLQVNADGSCNLNFQDDVQENVLSEQLRMTLAKWWDSARVRGLSGVCSSQLEAWQEAQASCLNALALSSGSRAVAYKQDTMTSLPLQMLRFSQESIRDTFKDGRPLQLMQSGLEAGSIHVGDVEVLWVALCQGRFYSWNNRRLWVYKQAFGSETCVPVEVMHITEDSDVGKDDSAALHEQGTRIRLRWCWRECCHSCGGSGHCGGERVEYRST